MFWSRLLSLSVLAMAINASAANTDEAAQRIDAALMKNLEQEAQHRQPPTPLVLPTECDDATFLRRVFIDIAGRLPNLDETQRFLASSDKDKRRALIDCCCENDSSASRYMIIAEALRVTDQVGRHSMTPFVSWLRQQSSQNRPWDQLVREMLLATGDLSRNPATGLLLRDSGHRIVTASALADALLGADTFCAQCHDHPFSDVTQSNLYRFAACFPVVRTERPKNWGKASSPPPPKTLLPGATPVGRRPQARAVAPTHDSGKGSWFGIVEAAQDAPPGMVLPADYKYRDGKPGEVVSARYLIVGRPPLTSSLPPGRITREMLADWFTKTQSSRLAQSIALRLWQRMFGTPGYPATQREGDFDRGDTNPYNTANCRTSLSRNQLISRMIDTPFAQALGLEMQHCHFDLREFQRILASTQAYQRIAIAETDLDRGQHALRGAPVVRRLSPDSLWQFLKSDEQPPGGAPPVAAPEAPDLDHPLRLFGAGSREWVDESEGIISHGLARYLCNAPLVEKTANQIAQQNDAATLYLHLLSRSPSDSETAAFALSGLAPTDAAWALLNTTEFLFQH